MNPTTACVAPFLLTAWAGRAAPSVPGLTEALSSRPDLQRESALRQPDEPSYGFFARLLPPPRSVHADFRYYPRHPLFLQPRLTRNMFGSGEGCALAPWDEGGRSFCCPPDRAANGHFLSMIAEVGLPSRPSPGQTLLRVRVPEGWRVQSPFAGGNEFPFLAPDPADLSELKGSLVVRFQVEKH